MAAVGNDEVQQVFDSNKENKSFELSSPLRNDFTFLCNGLDSFLESLKMDSVLPKGPEARSESGASAERVVPEDPGGPGCPPLRTKHPRTCEISEPPHLSKVLLKDYDCPKPIIFFNQSIPVASHQKFTKSIEFVQHRPSRPVDCLSKCRFPPQLRSLYKGIKPAPEPLPTPPKTRRGRQRNRLSLSDPHDFDNDDAYGRRNLLPTNEDLRTTYDKFFNFRRIPYLFKCSRGKSCECPVKCAQQVDSFGLFMEISPKPGSPLHPLVRENIDCVTRESCTVDEFSALVAVTAVQCKQTPLKRLFIPVSYHLKDKIGCLQGIIPEIFPELKIEEPVREVVEDLLEFVERQLSFAVNFGYDPDASCALSSADNSFNEESSQENIDSQNSITPTDDQSEPTPILPVQRKKRGKCKEQNKVVRELKKLVNVTVTDETEEVPADTKVNCSQPSCKFGCICHSINEKPQYAEHCNFIDCCLGCQCPEKSRETYVNIGDLSKEEKSWHQTVVRKRNNALEINYGVDRSKRRKKMPSRYENTVTGHAMNRFFDVSLRENRKSVEVKECKTPVSSKTIKPNMSLEKSKSQNTSAQKSAINAIFDEGMPKRDDEVAKRNAIIAEKMRKSLEKGQNKITASIERRLILTCGEACNSAGDVFIWCTIHNKYDCYCLSRIICGKNNNVICSPNSFNRSIADKFLGSMTLEPKSAADCREVAWYDKAKHCARTAGSIFNYEARNKDALFKKKLLYLLDNKIVSYSNNYIKAKPVATFSSETPSDNHPFVPALARKITRGVGEVVKIVPAPNSVVDVGSRLISSLPEQVLYLPPDDLNLESSDEEIVGQSEIVDNTDFLLDDPEFVPKPKRQILMPKPINRFCFSSHFQKKSRSPSNVEGKPNSSQHEPSSDSDVELVEDPIETYSLTSSPEPEFVDGGTLSDSDSNDDNGDSSISGKVDISNNEIYARDVQNHSHNDAKKSAVQDNCDSFSSPSKMVIDESVDTLTTPTKSVGGDCTSLNSLDESLLRDQSQRCRNGASGESRKTLNSQGNPSTFLEQRKADSQSVIETVLPTLEDEEDGYPKLGLFCMGLPDLGYVKIKESRPGNFIMEDPCEPRAVRIFKNCKEASDYMKQLVALCIDPELACSEWVMVTRGVLEKYLSKPFDSSHPGLLKKRKAEDSESKNKSLDKKRKLEVIKTKWDIKKTTKMQEKGQDTPKIIVKKNFDLKVQQNNSNSMDCNDIFQSSHVLLTGDESGSGEKINSHPPITPQSVAVPVTKKVVATFPNFSEANSFIEKNYQSTLYFRPSAPCTRPTGTIQTAGTSQMTGKLVRLTSPLLSGPKIRGGVAPNKTVRTLLVRGIARKPAVARPLLHIRPAPAGSTVTSAMSNGKIVSTTNAGVTKTMVDSVPSLSTNIDTRKSSVTTTFAGTGESSQTSSSIPISPSQAKTPMTSLSFPIRSCPKGSIVVSAAPFFSTPVKQVQSTATTSAARSVLSVGSTGPHSPGDSSSSGSSSNNVKLTVISDTINATPISSAGSTQAQVQNTDVSSTSGLTGSLSPLVATHVTGSASTVSMPVKKVESSTDSACADDGSPKEPVSCDGPLLPKHSDPPKVPGTFVIESFSTSSSPVSSASSPSTIVVRHSRPVIPKPVIPRVPPRRADVIVPRNEDFATLISPAPSAPPAQHPAPPAAKVPSENQVFNGVLLPKSDKKEIKAYICRKNSAAKSNYRSLLQKR